MMPLPFMAPSPTFCSIYTMHICRDAHSFFSEFRSNSNGSST
uniref:Uncharacterized protein n=1 Tax=Aegilops tauschii subsp. strangulata TaxID=200361 RepID=A0A453IKE3_AEGTS